MHGSLSSTPLCSWSDFRLLTIRIASQYLSTQLYGEQEMEPRSLCVIGKISSDRLISVFWKVNFLAKCKVTVIDYMEVKCTFRILLSVPEASLCDNLYTVGLVLTVYSASILIRFAMCFLDYIVLIGAINVFIYSKSQTILYELIIHIILKPIHMTILCRERTRWP